MHHPNHWRWHGAYPGQPYSASEFKDMLLKDALARAVPAGSNAGKGGSSEGSGGDDGAPIVSYEWSIMVPNLLARTQYQFQIVPYNRVGNGTRSYATSPPVLTAALADPLPRYMMSPLRISCASIHCLSYPFTLPLTSLLTHPLHTFSQIPSHAF